VNYKFKVTNFVGLTFETPVKNVKINFPNGLLIPYSSFGRTIGSYEIFSVPLIMQDQTIGGVLDELMPYNNTRWRISRYSANTDVNVELTITDPLNPGLGYWLIVANDPGLDLFTEPGRTVEALEDFYIELRSGWNQIGNPYTFDLNWEDLVTRNPGLPTAFRTYNGEIQNFQNSLVLEKMRGGFVNVSSDMRLYFPRINPNDTNGGRLKSNSLSLTNSIDNRDWEVNFVVRQDKISNVIGGLGMRHDASLEMDRYDGISMPRWNEYLDINHVQKSGKYHFSKDIVPSSEEHTWEFTIESSGTDKPTSIHWDNHYFGDNDFALMLYHEEAGVWIDMKQHKSYTFTAPASFRVLYGKEDRIHEQMNASAAQIVSVAPNPSTGPVSVYVSLPYPENEYPVELELVSLTGQSVSILYQGKLNSGYQVIEWSGTENGHRPVPGVYLLRMKCAGTITTHKVILK
jgi:hypothetical protein